MQDLSNDQKIKLLRELATIFRDWKKHADQGTYKDDEAGARKLIIEGLDKGAQAWSLLYSLQNKYDLLDKDPTCENRSGHVPLKYLKERWFGIAIEEISHHENTLVQEVTGQDGWEFIWHYLALANDLDRWINILRSTIPKDLITLAVAVQRYSVSRASIKRYIESGKIQSYRPVDAAKTVKHMISELEIAVYFPERKKIK